MKTIEFDWDQWNIQKNEIKHGVSALEAESVFFDQDYVLFEDRKHSQYEARYILVGQSSESRILMIGFTLKSPKVRIITARMASKKERAIYATKNKK